MAPEPRDIIWRSLLRRGRKDRINGRFRQWIVFTAVWSLTIFWLFPISFILGLTSMQSLSQHFTFLQYFLNTSFLIRSFIQNILPTLLVTLFMSFLPWILLGILYIICLYTRALIYMSRNIKTTRFCVLFRIRRYSIRKILSFCYIQCVDCISTWNNVSYHHVRCTL